MRWMEPIRWKSHQSMRFLSLRSTQETFSCKHEATFLPFHKRNSIKLRYKSIAQTLESPLHVFKPQIFNVGIKRRYFAQVFYAVKLLHVSMFHVQCTDTLTCAQDSFPGSYLLQFLCCAQHQVPSEQRLADAKKNLKSFCWERTEARRKKTTPIVVFFFTLALAFARCQWASTISAINSTSRTNFDYLPLQLLIFQITFFAHLLFFLHTFLSFRSCFLCFAAFIQYCDALALSRALLMHGRHCLNNEIASTRKVNGFPVSRNWFIN